VWPAVEVRMPMAARASRRPARRATPKRRRRIANPARALRWIGLIVLLAVAVGYVQPLRAYRDATADVARKRAEVDALARGNVALQGQIAEAGTPEFVEREARKLGLVKPGERLFIVTGVDRWKHEQRARAKARLR
jgi:cell division protein FtsB